MHFLWVARFLVELMHELVAHTYYLDLQLMTKDALSGPLETFKASNA